MADMRVNRAKAKLQAGEAAVCFAAWGYGGADALERLAPLEPDAIWLEGEHSDVDFCNIGSLTRAIDMTGATPIVRVHQNQAGVIYRTLDLGAQGICVPHVNTRAEAEAVVQAGKFAPIGLRGSFTSRQGIGVPDYFNRANDQTMLIVLIEDIIAVRNLDEILEVDGIDVFFVAPGDLAQTMGFSGQPFHPDVQKTVDDSLRRIAASGRTAGALVSNESAAHYADLGVKFFLAGPPAWIQSGYNEMKERAGSPISAPPDATPVAGSPRTLRRNTAKAKLQAGEIVIALGAPDHADSVERLGPMSPDAVWLEGEHGAVDPTNVGDLTRAVDLAGSSSIVRVNRNEEGLIYRTLDLGAQGIVVPHVNTRGEAEAVVRAGKFAPIGARGAYTGRQGIGVPDYLACANDETLLVVLIEDIVAVQNLDEILKVDHIDVFFVAASDLAQSMGHLGNPGHPEVQATLRDAIRRIAAAGRAAGTVATVESVGGFVEIGARFFLTHPMPWIEAGFSDLRQRVGTA